MARKQSDPKASLEDLEKADTPTLRRWYLNIEGNTPPKGLKGALLRGHLAWNLQAREQGLDPVALRQELVKLARQSQKPKSPTLSPGARLIREWQGVTHEVTVLDKGFSYRGERYTSLSQVAEIITGTHWSGPRFFGLKKADK